MQATTTERNASVNRVLILTLVLNVIVAAGKIVIGALTGALAISADGVHSLIDGASNVIALVAVRVAGKPPDADHPYGHRRFETIAALAIGILLLIAGWEIGSQAVGSLLAGGARAPEIDGLAFAVMIATLIVNIGVNRYERRAGEQLKSEVLLADAAHTGADILVTISVLVSMALTLAGFAWADAIAALAVVLFIVRAAWQVLNGAGGVLVDRAPISAETITAAARVTGVERVVRVRSRGTADAATVDVDVEVAPTLTADRAAVIADAIRTRLEDRLTGIAEVEVHFAPRTSSPILDAHASIALDEVVFVARMRADALGLSAHEVRLFEDAESDVDGVSLELHVEVMPGQTLAAAHERVTRLEQDIAAQLPNVARIVTHIEPALSDVPLSPHGVDDGGALIDAALSLLRAADPDAGWHDAHLSALDGGSALTIHAALPADLSVEDAHTRAEAAETLLRVRLPQLRRVTIHTEPRE